MNAKSRKIIVSTKSDLDFIIGSKIAIHVPRAFGNQLPLRITRYRFKSLLPNELIEFYHTQSG